MSTITCPSREELSAYVFGRLSDEALEAVAAHLEDLKTSMDWKASPENLPFSYQRIFL